MYVLIILAGVSRAPMAQEFSSEAACAQALRWVLEFTAASTRGVCLPKGDGPAPVAVSPARRGRT